MALTASSNLCVDYYALREALGRVIRAERHRKDIKSQEAFAQVVETHKNYVGAIERGERNVSLHLLVRTANALDMPLSRLIAEAEDLADSKR